MKLNQIWKLLAVVAAFGLPQAHAVTAITQPCALSDVKQNGVNSDGCAGAFDGNINPAGGTAILNGLTAGDWTGTAPNPLNGWLFGAQSVDGTQSSSLAGVTISYTDASPGNWVVTLGGYTQFVLGLKQGNEYAFYYFAAPTTSNGTYNVSGWGPGTGFDLSHAAVYVRNGGGGFPVPEPGTLALLGLGLIGLGLARRKA